MTIVHITQGLPASGKSTLARSLDALRFNLDDYRSMLGVSGDNWSKENEQIAVAAMIAGIKAAIKAGRDIVIDNTHLTPSLLKTYRKEFSKLGVTFKVHSLVDVDIKTCLERDANREASVGPEVILRLAKNYAKATQGGWRLTDKWMNGAQYVEPEPYVPDPSLPDVILCDIDGTVALHESHRGPFDWAKVGGDLPNENVVKIVKDLSLHTPIIFMSGRDASCREDTYEWLYKNFLTNDYGTNLFMRPEGDTRPDYVIKAELFDQHIRGNYNVLAVLDDRDQVVDLWRKMGITCLQVAPGDF